MLASTNIGFAQQKKNSIFSAPKVELTKTDITKLTYFDGASASIYDLSIGMSKRDALEVLKTLTQFDWSFDEYNTKSKDPDNYDEMPIYVNLKNPTAEQDGSVLYLTWSAISLQLRTIVVYADALPFFNGNIEKLFSTDAINDPATAAPFLKTKREIKDQGYTKDYLYSDQHFAFIYYINTENKPKVWFKLTQE